jgi:predicted RNA-binding Zn-ribbon protein involved in translation (DUF1610 family)
MDQDQRPVQEVTDADLALMRIRRELSTMPIEIRVADVCPRCGQHIVADELPRLQLFMEGGTVTCASCGMDKTYEPRR